MARVFRRRAVKKRAPRRGAKAVRRRISRTKGKKSSEYAECIETLQYRYMPDPTDPTNKIDMAVGQINGFYNFSLSMSDRAVQIARAYQYYRISKIEVEVLPMYDTWAPALGTGSMPYLYYLVDKNRNVVSKGTTFNSLRDAGAKAIKLDDKKVSFSFRPAIGGAVYDDKVITDIVTGNNVSSVAAGIRKMFSKPITSPWLSTNQNQNVDDPAAPATSWQPSSIDHRGFSLGVDSLIPSNASGGNTKYYITVRLHYQFKMPNTAINTVAPIQPKFFLMDLEAQEAV